MIEIRCQYCGGKKIIRHGWSKSGQKFKCKTCNRIFTMKEQLT